MRSPKFFIPFLFGSYILFFVSLTCSFRGFASIGIGLILVASLLKNKIETGRLFNTQVNNSFLIACVLFFLLQSTLLLFSSYDEATLRLIQLKSGLIFVPLAICCGNYLNAAFYQMLMKWYIRILTAALTFCLLNAVYQYLFLHQQPTVFFYHALVSPFHQHAVQVSILLFIGLVHLLEEAKKKTYLFNKLLHLLSVFYFTVLILLLSSKLVIIFTFFCLLYYFFLFLKNTINLRLISLIALLTGIVTIIFVLLSKNQVSKRFNEIIDGNLYLVEQKQFNPGIYFNGLQFRLLQARFVKEILDEKKAWLTGVSNEAQPLLVKKYISTNMYLGDGKKDHGYRDYNTHNQFLESLLQSGIVGLVSYGFIFLSLISLMIRRKSRELFFVASVLLAYSLNESVLERQYSIMIFTLFPLLVYYGTRKNRGSFPRRIARQR